MRILTIHWYIFWQVRVQANDGGAPSKSAVESVYINVTCAASVPQTRYRRSLLETALVGSYANVTLVAKGADGRDIPAGQVSFSLDDELFYVTRDGESLKYIILLWLNL